MHKLKQKRGRKTIVHHFHHVTEKDGTKKHVYLGTDPEKADERLTKLRLERMRSDNKLIKDVEKVQAKLSKLGHHNRSYDDIVKDIKMRHHKQKQVEKLLSKEIKTAFPFYGYLLILVAVIGIFAGLFYIVYEPSVTGAAVDVAVRIAANQIVSTAFGMLAVLLIVGLVLHWVDHRRKHRYDEYKPPQ